MTIHFIDKSHHLYSLNTAKMDLELKAFNILNHRGDGKYRIIKPRYYLDICKLYLNIFKYNLHISSNSFVTMFTFLSDFIHKF